MVATAGRDSWVYISGTLKLYIPTAGPFDRHSTSRDSSERTFLRTFRKLVLGLYLRFLASMPRILVL